MSNIPRLFQRKVYQILLIGIVILLVSVLQYFVIRDRILIILSVAVASICAYKAWELARIARGQKYVVITGKCISVEWAGERYRSVIFSDDAGTEWKFRVPKRFGFQCGLLYRLYLRTGRANLPFLEEWINGSCLLGYEMHSKHDI